MEVELCAGLSPERPVLIAVTSESVTEKESDKIDALLRGGFHRVHLRHPEASAETLRLILEKLPAEHQARIMLHSRFELAADYTLGGLHLNHRHPAPPAGYRGPLSRSCHSVKEVMQADPRLSYVTLSPIFDSISKNGYRSGFNDLDSLSVALASAPVPVIALGGISPERLSELSSCPFSGYAMLGSIPWDDTPEEIERFAVKTVKLLQIKR